MGVRRKEKGEGETARSGGRERSWGNLLSPSSFLPPFGHPLFISRHSLALQWNPTLRPPRLPMRPPRYYDHILQGPKRKNHRVILLFWRWRDHLVITTRILWPNGGRVNGIPMYLNAWDKLYWAQLEGITSKSTVFHFSSRQEKWSCNKASTCMTLARVR